MTYKAYNHNGTLIAESDKASDIFKMAKEYHEQTGNAYFIEEEEGQKEQKTILHWGIKITWSDGTEEFIDRIPDYVAREVEPFLDELEENENA
jgi:hypothetical protein